jgi:hypothetical protein
MMLTALNIQRPDAEAAKDSQKSQKDFLRFSVAHHEPYLQSRMRVGCAARSGRVACDGRFRARREAGVERSGTKRVFAALARKRSAQVPL